MEDFPTNGVPRKTGVSRTKGVPRTKEAPIKGIDITMEFLASLKDRQEQVAFQRCCAYAF